jgi:hypothetical protein
LDEHSPLIDVIWHTGHCIAEMGCFENDPFDLGIAIRLTSTLQALITHFQTYIRACPIEEDAPAARNKSKASLLKYTPIPKPTQVSQMIQVFEFVYLQSQDILLQQMDPDARKLMARVFKEHATMIRNEKIYHAEFTTSQLNYATLQGKFNQFRRAACQTILGALISYAATYGFIQPPIDFFDLHFNYMYADGAVDEPGPFVNKGKGQAVVYTNQDRYDLESDTEIRGSSRQRSPGWGKTSPSPPSSPQRYHSPNWTPTSPSPPSSPPPTRSSYWSADMPYPKSPSPMSDSGFSLLNEDMRR